jgi:hypothetical protein
LTTKVYSASYCGFGNYSPFTQVCSKSNCLSTTLLWAFCICTQSETSQTSCILFVKGNVELFEGLFGLVGVYALHQQAYIMRPQKEFQTLLQAFDRWSYAVV